ncbi:hypothetical protein SELMODRAFT_407102 [Selaginella moellendorffii]|uniref:Myb-like domain-containing protein n=1 Tax=Selaginella moellendorffii TaxID=88036 RepID=D8R3X3_SELML|nr:trihelix transcription factor ASR3 [Selaginella moellendorffii]EFJ33012.1 hypothetical protein SELMODRAFT_407102 [Selaginella moellendorffii]|eukprot:XP_002965592.1 trihelix transcription factor ASR3 [Selaginella moellendorffii]
MATAAAGEYHKKRKRGKNWSNQEAILLIEAKDATSREGMGASAKWQAVADHLESQGVLRDVEQCRSKWENMLGDYRSILEHERRGSSSYFALTKEQKKDLRLPAKFSQDMFQLLQRTVTRGEADMDALPVVNAAAPFVPGDSFSSEEVPGPGETPSLLQFREVGSSGTGATATATADPNPPAPHAATPNAAAATATTKRKLRSIAAEPGSGSFELVAKAISESQEKILAFLQEREERRIEIEERKLSRMDELFELLSNMAHSWKTLSERMLVNSSR